MFQFDCHVSIIVAMLLTNRIFFALTTYTSNISYIKPSPSSQVDVLELHLRLTSFGRVGKPSKSVPFRSPPAARYKVLLAVWFTSGALADQTPLRSLQGQSLRLRRKAQVDCNISVIILLG